MAELHPDDRALANEPAAYWTRLAYEAIIGFIRGQQAERGFTQPQFWILRHLSPHDLGAAGESRTTGELRLAMAEYLRPEDDLDLESQHLLERGLVSSDEEGGLAITASGETTLTSWRRLAPEIRALVHAGIDDREYVTAVKVLQRLIANTEDRSGGSEG